MFDKTNVLATFRYVRTHTTAVVEPPHIAHSRPKVCSHGGDDGKLSPQKPYLEQRDSKPRRHRSKAPLLLWPTNKAKRSLNLKATTQNAACNLNCSPPACPLLQPKTRRNQGKGGFTPGKVLRV